MAISIADQIALDDALVAPADRLKIGKCNLRLSSDVTSKEATLQVVYDVLKLTPFYKAFQVTADAPEIYMQEFWASAYVHNRSVRFKMNNKKHIIGLEQFRDILQICPKVGNKKFVEPPLEKEILIFLGRSDYAFLSVGGLHFPRLTNKNTKKGNAIVLFLGSPSLVVNFVMEKDPSIPEETWSIGSMPEMTNVQLQSNVHLKGMKPLSCWGYLPVGINKRGGTSATLNHTTEFMLWASGTIPTKTKGSKKKANYRYNQINRSLSTFPQGNDVWKAKQSLQSWEELSLRLNLTEAEQLKIIIKKKPSQKLTALMPVFRDSDNEVARNDWLKGAKSDEEDTMKWINGTGQSKIPKPILMEEMMKAIGVAVQLKYDRIEKSTNYINQQFLDSIDGRNKKNHKEQVKKEVSKLYSKHSREVRKTDQTRVEVTGEDHQRSQHIS
ncbi:hypothetical protein Tco_0352440 [Tanacetum coccineum]